LGQDFREHLNDIVGGCAAVLAIIGPKWSDIRNDAGQKRLDDPDDFVRIELEAALARNVPVVPVLVGHAPMPGPSQLPSSLSSLAFRQSIEVRPDPDFHNDATRLVAALKRILDPSATVAPEPDGIGESQGGRTVARRRDTRVAWIVASAFGIAAAALAIPAWKHLFQPALPEFRSEISTPDSDRPLDFALSPDGRQIAYVAMDRDASRLWLRSLESGEARSLPGTDGAMAPFWSPDGATLGYLRNNSLNRFDIKSGQSRVIVHTSSINPAGASWSASGTILFAPSFIGPLFKVSATGGDVTQVTQLDSAQVGHVRPQFLPDGRHFLFQAAGTPNRSGAYLASLDGLAPTRLTESGSGIAYMHSGWMVFERDGSLIAQRLDADKASLMGEPVTLTAAAAATDSGSSGVSVASGGLIAYRASSGRTRQLQWFNHKGELLGTVGDEDPTISNPRISPDGQRIAVDRTVNGNADIWLLDGARSIRFTFDPQVDQRSLWSADGREIMFYSLRMGTMDLYHKPSDGSGAESRLYDTVPDTDRVRVPTSVSRDGRYLLYMSAGDRKGLEMKVLSLKSDRVPKGWLRTQFNESWGVFSPDGRWVAYVSDESGPTQVYVRRFVPADANSPTAGQAGSRWQVSASGGSYPVWRPDGKELYFLSPGGDMMAASITASAASITSGAPAKLFATHIFGAGRESAQGRQYDVAPDGRFLINSELVAGTAPPITLIQNWKPEARK
jgi:Tol biopolymer transport system component